jgi:lipoprotein-releasing system ATP-binding protein
MDPHAHIRSLAPEGAQASLGAAQREAASSAPTLRLEGVSKSYGVGTPVEAEVLHGIDLTLQKGEFAALIGPSGSGKTTLLNLIGLLDRPSAGRLFIAGEDAGALAPIERTKLRGRAIGFIFQYHYLLPAFTALENVMMPILAARGKLDDEMRERAASLLERVGLTPWRNHKASDISGGQQQRVAIARALAMNPALVLADEPSGNLDTENADAVFDLMRDVNVASGTTFLIVTHDPRLARRCDRIVELVDGRVTSDRPNLDVRQRGWSDPGTA